MEARKAVAEAIEAVSQGRIAKHLRYLTEDPLPCRTLNWSRPGKAASTLHEADEYIRTALREFGYDIEESIVPVQAFVPDEAAAWGFRKPFPEEPWFDAVNIVGTKPGRRNSNECVVALAHKDSQSWLHCGPGASDNAVGVASLLEIGRVLSSVTFDVDLKLLFCNEEHWPWTSVNAAEKFVADGIAPRVVLNLDSIGGKSQKESNLTNIVRYSTPEGARIADIVEEIGSAYDIGLTHGRAYSEIPNDDDGSFVNAGIKQAVLFIGSYPYADENYHTVDDTFEKVDLENVYRTTQLALASLSTFGIGTRDSY